MRVLHVIPAVAQCYGGPSSAIAPMCQALAALGVETLIVTTDADGPARLPVRIGEVTSWQGAPTLFFKKDFTESFKYSHGLSGWLRRHVRDFDLVHIHAVLSHAPLASAAACRRATVPYIVRPLGTIAPWSLGRKTFRKRLLLAVSAGRMLREAAALHYTTEQEKHEVEQTLGLTRGVVIPLGIDPQCLAKPLVPAFERGRDRYVLLLSRLHPKKNIEAVINALVGVHERGADWRLVIAGKGDDGYVRSLERLVHDRGAAEYVSFAGWVDGDTKRNLIGRASLFALPSLHENFGVSLVEAMAAGVPALVSRQVHLAGAIEAARAGWIVDSDDESLRCGLGEALDNSDERERRGLAARELAQRFAWPGVAAQLVGLYGQVTRQGGHESPAAALPSAVALDR